MLEIEEPVLIEATAPVGHAEAVEAVLERSGLDVRVEAAVERRSAGLLPWLIRIAVEGTIYELLKYVAASGTTGIKEMFRDLVDARDGAGSGKGSIELVDAEHTHVILSSTLPDEAIEALSELDWTEKRGDYLVWSDDRREWRDPTKRD
jgi:hypothetical protein